MATTTYDRPIGWVCVFAATMGMLQSPSVHADDDGTENGRQLIEEFFLTESVYAQERGELQITLGTADINGSPESDGLIAELGAEYGLSDRLQLEVSQTVWLDLQAVENDGRESKRGAGDLEFGLKYALRSDGIHVAAGLEITAPVGDVDDDLGDGLWSFEPFVIVGKDLGDAAAVTFGLAYGIRRRDQAPADASEAEAETDEIEVSLGLVRAISHSWRTTLELTFETDKLGGRGEESEAYLAPGIVYKGWGDLEFGLGGAFGLTDDSADWSILGLVSYEF